MDAMRSPCVSGTSSRTTRSATDAQNLTFQLGHHVFVDLTSGELRLCAPVSSCEIVGWTASPGTHWYAGEPFAASVDWKTQGVVDCREGGTAWSLPVFSPQQDRSKVR